MSVLGFKRDVYTHLDRIPWTTTRWNTGMREVDAYLDLLSSGRSAAEPAFREEREALRATIDRLRGLEAGRAYTICQHLWHRSRKEDDGGEAYDECSARRKLSNLIPRSSKTTKDLGGRIHLGPDEVVHLITVRARLATTSLEREWSVGALSALLASREAFSKSRIDRAIDALVASAYDRVGIDFAATLAAEGERALGRDPGAHHMVQRAVAADARFRRAQQALEAKAHPAVQNLLSTYATSTSEAEVKRAGADFAKALVCLSQRARGVAVADIVRLAALRAADPEFADLTEYAVDRRHKAARNLLRQLATRSALSRGTEFSAEEAEMIFRAAMPPNKYGIVEYALDTEELFRSVGAALSKEFLVREGLELLSPATRRPIFLALRESHPEILTPDNDPALNRVAAQALASKHWIREVLTNGYGTAITFDAPPPDPGEPWIGANGQINATANIVPHYAYGAWQVSRNGTPLARSLKVLTALAESGVRNIAKLDAGEGEASPGPYGDPSDGAVTLAKEAAEAWGRGDRQGPAIQALRDAEERAVESIIALRDLVQDELLLDEETARTWCDIRDALLLPTDASRPTAEWKKTAKAIAATHSAMILAKLDGHRPTYRSTYCHEALSEAPSYDIWLQIREEMLNYALSMAYAPPADAGPVLARLAIRCFVPEPRVGARAKDLGKACLWALEAMPDGTGAAFLARVQPRVRYPSVKKSIAKALDRLAKKAGLDRADLEELNVADHGLDWDDRAIEPVGSGQAIFTATGAAAHLTWQDANGKVTKSAPRSIKDVDSAGVKAARHRLKEIETDLTTAALRIEAQYLGARSLAYGDWRARYATHGTLGPIARRLIWRASNGTDSESFLPNEDGGINAQGHPIAVHDGMTVTLWHPVHAQEDERASWRALLEAREIRQPFRQAWREIYAITDAERETGTYSNRWAAHILRQHKAMALARQNGWSVRHRVGFDTPNDAPMNLHVPAFGLYAELWTEGAGGNHAPTVESGAYTFISTDRLRFCRLDTGRPHGRGEPVPLAAVPEIVFSEVMRHGDLFTSVASIATDPNWTDGGADAAHPGGWGRLADNYRLSILDADLVPTAQTRRALLQKLLPKLKSLSKVATLGERHLFVTGRVNNYRIHLGSGAVGIGESGRHVCIVPDGSQRGTRIALPFEGDTTFSLILSKALALAKDDELQDPVIVRQIL